MVSFVLSFIALLRRNASLKDIFPLVSYIVVLVNQYKLEEDFNPISIFSATAFKIERYLCQMLTIVYRLNTMQLIILFKFASNAVLLI